MERISSAIRELVSIAYFLPCGIKQEIGKIRALILESGVPEMLKKLFEAAEAMLRAVIYLLILVMGLSSASLGAYTILLLAFRIGEFLWEAIFKEAWL